MPRVAEKPATDAQNAVTNTITQMLEQRMPVTVNKAVSEAVALAMAAQIPTQVPAPAAVPVLNPVATAVPSVTPLANKIPKPSYFTGKSQEQANWLHSMDTFLTAHNIDYTSGAAVNIASAFLQESALTWWRNYHAELQAGTKAFPTWVQWVNELRRAFTPLNAAKIARQKIHNIRQHTSVPKYSHEFPSLLLDVPTMGADDVLFNYMQGLKPSVKVLVEAAKPTDVHDAIQKAADVDNTLYFGNKGRGSDNNKSPALFKSYKSAASHNGPAPMEVNAMTRTNGPRLTKLTDKEREYCRKHSLCFLVTQAVIASKPTLARETARAQTASSRRPGAPQVAGARYSRLDVFTR